MAMNNEHEATNCSTHEKPQKCGRIIRQPEVSKMTSLSRASIYSLMKKGEFPNKFKIFTDPNARVVGWCYYAVQGWIKNRAGSCEECSDES
jgi:predicted DNA-binding transcriptional regulator AlpA